MTVDDLFTDHVAAGFDAHGFWRLTLREVALCRKAAVKRAAEASVRAVQAAWAGTNLDRNGIEALCRRILDGGPAPAARIEDLMRDAESRVPTITMAEALQRMH